MKKILEIENLSVSFINRCQKIQAVRNTGFEVFEGEILGVVGESGCGKSAMAKSILGLLPKSNSLIESGKINYQGENILLQSEKKLREIRGKKIGMIFQDPMSSLNPTMKIGSQIVEGYLNHYPKSTKNQAFHLAIKMLENVGISEANQRINQYPHELSGGMRQRVMIAIAMISSPQILIADEPTTALDVTVQAQILELLLEIQKKELMSILLITHDLSIVARYCNRIIVMYGGKVIEKAPVEDIFYYPKHPYTKRLINSIVRSDLPNDRYLHTVAGNPPDLSPNFEGCNFQDRSPQCMGVCKNKSPKKIETKQNHEVSCWLYSDHDNQKAKV